ncbi:MAG: tetraacyldisaccharide 4'-kinase [Candidatus Omnitrophota bacterium]
MATYFENLATDRVGGGVAFFVKAFLWLLSLVYGLIVVVVSGVCCAKAVALKASVISIGNITWGGTGKTPLVELLARFLQCKGRKVAVLTRGYKRHMSEMGDEPYMLSQKLPGVEIIVNRDRIRGAAEAVHAHGADTLILDDGLQQWRIRKDMEIVTIDAGNPFGNGSMIPRGILREPLGALERADIFVLTNTDGIADCGILKARLAAFNPKGIIVVARHKPAGFFMLSDPSKSCTVERLQSKPVALVSGIGNPDSFRRVIERMQIPVARAFEFPDHHRYSKADMRAVMEGVRQNNIETIITTEKDADKLRLCAAEAALPDIVVLRVSLEIIENEEQFYSRLLSLYSA